MGKKLGFGQGTPFTTTATAVVHAQPSGPSHGQVVSECRDTSTTSDETSTFWSSSYSAFSLMYLAPYRMLQFELTESESQQIELKFIKCSFVEDCKPFTFRENGIIGKYTTILPAMWYCGHE